MRAVQSVNHDINRDAVISMNERPKALDKLVYRHYDFTSIAHAAPSVEPPAAGSVVGSFVILPAIPETQGRPYQ